MNRLPRCTLDKCKYDMSSRTYTNNPRSGHRTVNGKCRKYMTKCEFKEVPNA